MGNTPARAKKLFMLDPYNFIDQLNRIIDRTESPFKLGTPQEKKPRKPFYLTTLLDDREEFSTLKYPIIQIVEHRSLAEQVLGVDGEEMDFQEGYIFAEQGTFKDRGTGDARYETLKIRIKKPLELRQGGILAPTTIQIGAYSLECCTPEIDTPRFHTKSSFLRQWKKTDLSSLMPIEWFLSTNLRNNYSNIPR